MGQKAKVIVKRGFVGLVFLLLLVPALVLGQAATPAPDCSPEAHALILDKYAAAIRGAGADVGAQLSAMQTDLAALDAACNGLSFKGGIGGKVLGPVTLAAGLYKATATTAGPFIAKLQLTQGQCGGGSFGDTLLFSEVPGQANGAETIIQSSGCTVYIVLDDITDAWTLSIVPLG